MEESVYYLELDIRQYKKEKQQQMFMIIWGNFMLNYKVKGLKISSFIKLRINSTRFDNMLNNKNFKKQLKCMALVGKIIKSNLLMSLLLVMYVMFLDIPSYIIEKKKIKMIPRPYLGIFYGCKGENN